MASITRQKNGGFQIQFVRTDKRRRSVRLGKVKPKSAELIKLRIEQLVAAKKTGVLNDPELTQWINGISDQLHSKLARFEWIPARQAKQIVELKAFLDDYKVRRNDVKPATYEVWRQPMRNLEEIFGAERGITTITEAEALDFPQLLFRSKLASTTVSKRLQFVKSFFNDARRRKLIKENPFAEVSSKSVIRLDQRHFVPLADAEKLRGSCPNHYLARPLQRFAVPVGGTLASMAGYYLGRKADCGPIPQNGEAWKRESSDSDVFEIENGFG